MEGIKGQRSIGRIFALYIIVFCMATVVLSVIVFACFGIMMKKGVVRPANYYEQYIEKNRNDIAQVKDVKSLIPAELSYGVFDLEGKMVQGNASEKKASELLKIIEDNRINSRSYSYKIIQREKEICVVEYTLIAQFANPVLQKYVPNVERAFLLLYIILFIGEVIIFSKYFRRRLIREMKVLKRATENIQVENLNFPIEYSNILEINDVISALAKMKAELQQSLDKQWRMEESRKEQMGALAHDIKTPLTILRGNAELLSELDLNKEQSVFIKNILIESSKMESYIKSLIEIMKTEKEAVLQKKQIELAGFIHEIEKVGRSLSREKSISFISKIEDIPDFLLADKEALNRAIVNVISNAVDYTPEKGEIIFEVCKENEHIKFIVEDSGRGFTEEELTYATEQFFQGDKSRNSKNHYGMGLYITRELVRQHNGTIALERSEKLGGARVVLEIP